MTEEIEARLTDEQIGRSIREKALVVVQNAKAMGPCGFSESQPLIIDCGFGRFAVQIFTTGETQ